ncbi:MAG: PQQ-binding-like beta-propeller repeat protein [Chloroflexota bacterium]|nr:PQQ-binding-like beta-propeller repeat protein [Chloroflexota bacterium]
MKNKSILLALLLLALGVGGVTGILALRASEQTRQSATVEGWPSYLYDAAHSGFNGNEVRLSPRNAANLKLLWKHKIGNVLAAQPIIKGGSVYIGSWDGSLYALDAHNGSLKWKVDLGKTTSKLCAPQTAGITSAAAVTDQALYVGGGDQYLYALDPQTGKTIWKFQTGDNSETGGAYNWASPVVYHGRVYYGSSSFCDRPFPHGEMWGINTATGKAEQHADFIPTGQRGGGLWTSPTVDEATGAFYVTIGSGDYYVPYNYSIARLDPQTLAVTNAWQIPSDKQVFDGDWGTTPTLFRAQDGSLMVGAGAKNGYYYAFKADKIGTGPVWSVRIADGGQCPQCGEGDVSSSAYAYGTVYAAAGYTSLGEAQKFAGSVRALDPTTGATRWIHTTVGSVVPALTVANGLVVAAADDTVEVLDAASGELLWDYATEASIYAAPSVADGVLYVASNDGYLYAFSAGPYSDEATAYEVHTVGSNPPGFTPFRKVVAATPLPGSEQCYKETGKCVHSLFLDFFNARGGIERFGPPATGEINQAGRTVQYFRNAVLELHPTANGTGLEVRMGKLDFRLLYFTPTNTSFDPAQPISGTTFVPETHHNLPEPFLSYWKAHGDVANLGYPVSEPLDEYNPISDQVLHVQYFERSRLELIKEKDGTEHISVGALGLQRYKDLYGVLP